MTKLTLAVFGVALGLVSPMACFSQFSTVMLPSQSQFSVNTSVLVPDSGGVLLGSVNRASSGYVSRGFSPFTNRAFGRSLGSSTATAHVYVIDLGEMDRRMLEEAAGLRHASYRQYVMAYPKVAQATKITSDGRNDLAATSEAKRVTSGLSLADQKKLADDEDAVALAKNHAAAARSLERAEEAEHKGMPGVAKSYYLAAVRQGNSAVRKQASEGYRRVLAATSKEVAQP